MAEAESKTEELMHIKDIEWGFDISDVTENELSLAKRWCDHIVLDEKETQKHNLGFTYPPA